MYRMGICNAKVLDGRTYLHHLVRIVFWRRRGAKLSENEPPISSSCIACLMRAASHTACVDTFQTLQNSYHGRTGYIHLAGMHQEPKKLKPEKKVEVIQSPPRSTAN